MFRQPHRPRACLAFLLGLGLSVSAVPAQSQDRSPYERLDRLERDLNMLQRHVYRGAPAPVYAADGASAVNAQLRMDRLEAEMRELTGRVEEFMNLVQQLRQRLDQLHSDVDMRFSQGSAGPGPLAGAAPPGRSAPAAARTSRSGAPDPGASDDEAPRAGGPTPILGALTPPGAPPRSTELASAGPAAHPGSAGALPGGSATEQYNHAFGLLKQANYPAAEAAFRAFLDAHPKDQMAGNAQYWLGETYYARDKYMDAASAFARLYDRYPKSSKAPDGLLKLGMSLGRANQKDKACIALAQLGKDFPRAATSIRERAAAEKRRMGC